jgi:spore coat polysaccharide biosynthesis predicted glycosyltransferase SpsG
MEQEPQPHVTLVADAAPDVGLGHITRTGALAVALRARGTAVACHGYGATKPFERDGVEWQPLASPAELPEPAGVLVLDSYRLDAGELPDGGPLVVMHDQAGAPDRAALVVSVASADPGDRWLTGPRHACLRRSFWGLPIATIGAGVERVLVTTGGGDPGANAYAIAAAAARGAPDAQVSLVVGPQSAVEPPPGVRELRVSNLRDALRAADVVVTGAGQTMLEAAAVGAPCVAVVLSDNQRRQGERLAADDAVRLVPSPDASAVEAAVAGLVASRDERVALARAAQAAVDGYGAFRVAFRVAELA